MLESFRQLNKFLSNYEQLAVVCHRRPDGDAVGSLLAWGRFLQSQGKIAELYCFDTIPRSFGFLSGLEKIKQEVDGFWASAPAVLLVDCGDLAMPGIAPEHFAGKRLAAVDHHVTNPAYGEVNCLQPAASSTAEIIFNFFTHHNFIVDKETATALLLGVYSDTDGFSNLATTPDSLAAAAALLKRGARFREIAALGRRQTVSSLKLWGRALERLRLDREKGIAVTVIRESDFADCQASPEDAEGISSFLNNLAGVKMAMVLREVGDGTVKGSLRTTSELIDVAKVAKLLGGGGHAKAAGFTVKGRIEETEGGWKIVE